MTLGTPSARSSREAVVQRPSSTPSPAPVVPPQVESSVGRVIRGTAKVVDGNTVVVGGTVIVLHGADAPEAGQSCLDMRSVPWDCGGKASRQLERMVAGKTLTCVVEEEIPGAVAATCVSGGTDFGKAMVRDGFAVVPEYLAPIHAAEQAEARAAGRGVWVGSFERPEVFRGKMQSP